MFLCWYDIWPAYICLAFLEKHRVLELKETSLYQNSYFVDEENVTQKGKMTYSESYS